MEFSIEKRNLDSLGLGPPGIEGKRILSITEAALCISLTLGCFYGAVERKGSIYRLLNNFRSNKQRVWPLPYMDTISMLNYNSKQSD